MKDIHVNLGRNSYQIHIGAGLLGQAAEIIKALGCSGKAVIITDPTVNRLYGARLRDNLDAGGFQTALLEVPEGEEYKSLETASRLYEELTAFGSERGAPVVALGGGVIGDVAGFVAATYVRGVPLIQLPTTLLAQVDSSIGGKVAVNHGMLKNRIGAFYQPRAVIADLKALSSLPPEQITSGLGEVIKYAVIRDAAFFAYLEENIDAIRRLDENVLEHVVAVCAGIKAAVVEKDELDLGLRNILNFGHTVGHAIETVTDFGVSHGNAVAIGMMAACAIGIRMSVFDAASTDRLRRLLDRAGLMTRLPKVDVSRVLEALSHDKKAAGGRVKFVLPCMIGDVFVTDMVDVKHVERTLAEMR